MSFTHIALHVSDVRACIKFYCEFAGLEVIRERKTSLNEESLIAWLAEPTKHDSFIFVILPSGTYLKQHDNNFSHLGFAVKNKRAVDELADRARELNVLAWEPRQEPYPVGYYCGVYDPNGTIVEFSYGQPLGEDNLASEEHDNECP